MSRILSTACTLLLALAASAALAADESTLARERNCLICHNAEKRVVGPSFKEISDRNQDKSGAQERLAQKILKGGSGVWGPVPMPANGLVSPAEAERLAAWILTLR